MKGGQITHGFNISWISVQVCNDDCVNAARDDAADRVEIGTQRRRVEIIEANANAGANSRGCEVNARVARIGDGSTRRNDGEQCEHECRRSTVRKQYVQCLVPLAQSFYYRLIVARE